MNNDLSPSVIVIFGITGDLSKRYLLPALYRLFKHNLLHEHTRIIGLTRQSLTTDDVLNEVEVCINEDNGTCDPAVFHKLKDHTTVLQFDPDEATDYPQLLERLNQLEEEIGMCLNRLYYLSIPPKLFTTVVQHMGAAGLNGSCQHNNAHSRLLVEKPFGHDLASAEELVRQTNAVFAEQQVFRIDHYLAKETVQNILTFRLHNPIFSNIWNNRYITAIDILASEQIGIAGRAQFYEGVGALRDFIQSHLLQLAAITTMELPAELESHAIHQARQKLLEAVKPVDPVHAVRGQYEGYRNEVGNDQSTTETYAHIETSIDSDRWRDVPLRITTGKALAEKRTEICVTFTNPNDEADVTNTLTFRVYPKEGIEVQLRVKKPGFVHELQEAPMEFDYQQTFGDEKQRPDAYERVLVDAIKGDRTLFATSAEVLASWHIIEPVIEAWKGNGDGLQIYQQGSNSPS